MTVRSYVLFLCLAGCSSFDRELVLRTRAQLERAGTAFRQHEGPPQPQAPLPAAWAKGQFAVWAINEGDSDVTTLTAAQVEEADENGFIVTMTIINPRLRTTARLTFSRQPRTHDEARDFLTQVIRRRGEERALTYRFHADMPVDMRDALEPLWATLVPQPVEGPPETASTLSSTMEGCRPAQARFIYSPLELEVRGLLHPAVPINGLVFAKAKSGETLQLIEHGWSGGGPAL